VLTSTPYPGSQPTIKFSAYDQKALSHPDCEGHAVVSGIQDVLVLEVASAADVDISKADSDAVQSKGDTRETNPLWGRERDIHQYQGSLQLAKLGSIAY
jgi:hypothetical protein